MTKLKEMCKVLRLAYVSDIYTDIPYENSSQFLESVFQKELELREEAKATQLIKKAKFLQKKLLSSFQWSENIHFPSHIDSQELCNLNFIGQKI